MLIEGFKVWGLNQKFFIKESLGYYHHQLMPAIIQFLFAWMHFLYLVSNFCSFQSQILFLTFQQNISTLKLSTSVLELMKLAAFKSKLSLKLGVSLVKPSQSLFKAFRVHCFYWLLSTQVNWAQFLITQQYAGVR